MEEVHLHASVTILVKTFTGNKNTFFLHVNKSNFLLAAQGGRPDWLHNRYWEAHWQEALRGKQLSQFFSLNLGFTSEAVQQCSRIGPGETFASKAPFVLGPRIAPGASAVSQAGFPIDFPPPLLPQARAAGHCGCACWLSPGCSPTNMDVPPSLAVEGCSLAQWVKNMQRLLMGLGSGDSFLSLWPCRDRVRGHHSTHPHSYPNREPNARSGKWVPRVWTQKHHEDYFPGSK